MGRRKLQANGKDEGPPRKYVKIDLPLPVLPTERGFVLSCGQGTMGQLGLGEDEMERKKPALLTPLKDIVEICAGGMHSLALTKDGKLYSFGCNDEGALGRDITEKDSEFEPRLIDLPDKCIKISAGDSHSACLLANGEVYAWGSFRDSHGNMGLTIDGNQLKPFSVLPDIKACNIASGADHLVILTTAGILYTMGCAEQGQLGRVAIRSAGIDSRRGKANLLSPKVVYSKRIKAARDIWATTYCTFLRDIKTDEIYAFGLNNYNQLGLQIKEGQELSVATPTLTTFKNVKHIAGGQHHTLVLTNDNKCHVIGRKEYGRLGLGNITEDPTELTPIKSLSEHEIATIACGESQSFAVTKQGNIYAWGMGSNLQLGTGSEDDETEPKLIVSKQTQDAFALKVASGGQHSLFLVQDKNASKEEKQQKVAAGGKINNSHSTDDQSIENVVDIKTDSIAGDSNEGDPNTATTAKRGRKKAR